MYGIELNFQSNSKFYIEELINDFAYFRPKPTKKRYHDFSITIHLVDASNHFPVNYSLRLNRESEIGSGHRKFRILNYGKWHLIEHNYAETIYLLAPTLNTCHIFTTQEDTEIYHAITDIVMNFLSMCLLKRNIFCVHAAALSKDGKGFLFPGRSGSGKTTISISLVQSGYKFLSDDYPLIKDDNSHFEILAFPQRLKVRNDTLKQFPELVAYKKRKNITMARPFIDISEVFLDCVSEKVEAIYLVFPHLINSQKTSCMKTSKSEALRKLLPCIYDPFSNIESSVTFRKTIFEFAYNLVNKTKCFNLFLGKNASKLQNSLETIKIS